MISGRTRVAGVVGNPVDHSLSPRIHNAAFAALGLDWVYVAFPVTAGDRVVEAMRTVGIAGMSVTMPHKEAVARTADRRTEAVERLGVANTLFRQDGEIWADTTDGDGFVAAYQAGFGHRLGGRTVAVLGAGGAARSIIEAAGRAGADAVLVVNRSRERAREAASVSPVAEAVDASAVVEAEIIVNATSVGMDGGPAPGASPLAPGLVRRHHEVVDIVYQPRVTPLLAHAAEAGASTQGGVAMLVHQAALQFERWTGGAAPIGAMTRAVLDDLG